MRGASIDGGMSRLQGEVGQRRIGSIALPARPRRALVTRRRGAALRCSAVPQNKHADGILHHATITPEVVSSKACNILFWHLRPPL